MSSVERVQSVLSFDEIDATVSLAVICPGRLTLITRNLRKCNFVMTKNSAVRLRRFDGHTLTHSSSSLFAGAVLAVRGTAATEEKRTGVAPLGRCWLKRLAIGKGVCKYRAELL